MTRRWAALTLALGILCPPPALAEIPRTTAEWLAVYKERQARFDAVEIESHWQRLEGEKIVEEWDQVYYADDLGRLQLEEFGRTEGQPDRQGVAFLVDSALGFDGVEYREVYSRWEFSQRSGLTSEERAQLRSLPPAVRQSRIDDEAGDFASIRRADTPFKACDYWFLLCVNNAHKAGIEPRTSPVAGQLDRWEVMLDSRLDVWGHKCRAIVDTGQDNHVVSLDLWSDGGWVSRFDVEYTQDGSRWVPARGQYASLRQPKSAASLNAWRFAMRRIQLGERRGDGQVLPVLVEGTYVWDRRTDANYRVVGDGDAEGAVARLVAQAHQEFGALTASRQVAFRRSAWFRRIALYAAAGGLVGLALDRLCRWAAASAGKRRMSQRTTESWASSDSSHSESLVRPPAPAAGSALQALQCTLPRNSRIK